MTGVECAVVEGLWRLEAYTTGLQLLIDGYRLECEKVRKFDRVDGKLVGDLNVRRLATT